MNKTVHEEILSRAIDSLVAVRRGIVEGADLPDTVLHNGQIWAHLAAVVCFSKRVTRDTPAVMQG